MTSAISGGDALGEARHRALTATQRLAAAFARHRATILWLVPVVVLGGTIQAINMGGNPIRIDDEGTYTAQAWSIFHFGQLTHYTYWYDHPPLGWIQIALYTELTGAWARYSVEVLAAREAMLVAAIASSIILWFLARRIGLSRATASVAVLLFMLSPLAIAMHRTVYLDNVAVPWLLGAFSLALSKKNQLAAFAGAAVCFGIAVLSKETTLLAFPFLLWVMVRGARPETRRYSLSVAGCIVVLMGGSYLMLAAVKGELLPGAHITSLTDGIIFQLGGRQSSGSMLDPNSLASRTLGTWWNLDAVGMTAGAAAAVLGLLVKRLRPFAAVLAFLVLMMLRPGGYLPAPYIIALLPFGALLIAGVGEVVVRRIGALLPRVRIARPAAVVALTTAGVLAAAPAWAAPMQSLLTSNQDAPMQAAQSWILTNVDRNTRLIVDDAMWVDLVNAGWNRNNVVWYYKVDTDPAVQALSPRGWQDADYIVTTGPMLNTPELFPQVSQAVANSVVVASFGTGTHQAQVRRIDANGIADARAQATAGAAARKAGGAALAASPALQASAADRSLMSTGSLDGRAVTALTGAAAVAPVTVSALPRIAGEDSTAIRQVEVSAAGGQPVVANGALTDAGTRFIHSIPAAVMPTSAVATPTGILLTWPVDLAGQTVP